MSQEQAELDYKQLSILKYNLRMEKAGMMHSAQRGRKLRPQLAERFGLKPRDSYDLYISEVQKRMDAIVSAQAGKE